MTNEMMGNFYTNLVMFCFPSMWVLFESLVHAQSLFYGGMVVGLDNG
jgi:hypothetical protein